MVWWGEALCTGGVAPLNHRLLSATSFELEDHNEIEFLLLPMGKMPMTIESPMS